MQLTKDRSHCGLNRAFTLVEVMMVTVISAFVFAGVLSAYIFLGRGLMRQSNEELLESRARLALYDFTQDVSAASSANIVTTTNPPTVILVLNTWVPTYAAPYSQNPSPPISGTATYTYDGQHLSLIRSVPFGSPALAFPNWPTSGMVLLNNLVSFGPDGVVPLFNIYTYDIQQNKNTYNIAQNSSANPSSIKQISVAFQIASANPEETLAQAQTSGAQARLTIVSSPVLMKNKPVEIQ